VGSGFLLFSNRTKLSKCGNKEITKSNLTTFDYLWELEEILSKSGKNKRLCRKYSSHHYRK